MHGRFFPFRLCTKRITTGEIPLQVAIGAGLGFIAGILITAPLVVHAQESVQEEPFPSSIEPLPLPSAAEPEPSPAVSAPFSTEPSVPSAEPPSSSGNYTLAQSDLLPPRSVPTAPFGGGLDAKSVVPGGETVSSGEPRRFHYVLRLSVRGVYDDNIFISHTDRVSDYYFAIEPSITVGFGDIEGRGGNYIRLDYMPSVILFVDHSDEDTVEHLIRLEGQYHFSRLTLNLTQDVDILDGANLNSTLDTTGLWANVDVSARTRLNLYATRLRANYELSGKLFLAGEFNASIYDYPDFISSQNISGGLYINYQWTPKVLVGLGGTIGYDFVDDPNPDQSFEQANLRINYQATGKLSLATSVGVEVRQFDGHRGDRVTPVFEVGAIYNPFDGTSITLAAGRRMLNSGFFADQDFATTYVIARIQQRLFQRIYLGLAVGYESSDYFRTATGVSATRNDDYYFVEPSVDVLITRWLSAGVYYLHREGSSSLDFFSFYDNQVGVRATVRF
jgi:Putative beta-barrel porin 2